MDFELSDLIGLVEKSLSLVLSRRYVIHQLRLGLPIDDITLLSIKG